MEKWGHISLAMVLISMIAACTYTATNDSFGGNFRNCISAGCEWIDGDCVRGKP